TLGADALERVGPNERAAGRQLQDNCGAAAADIGGPRTGVEVHGSVERPRHVDVAARHREDRVLEVAEDRPVLLSLADDLVRPRGRPVAAVQPEDEYVTWIHVAH